MSNKVLYIIVAVLIVLGLGFYIYHNHQAQAPTVENSQTTTTPANQESPDNTNPQATAPAPTNTTNNSTSANPANNGGTFSGEGDIMGKTYVVNYDGSGFSPKTLTVKVGDTVVFKNNSSSAFWPASNPHPTHTAYPEFDAKKAIAAGSSYTFVFTKLGTWGYHNHLNSAQGGTITVTK